MENISLEMYLWYGVQFWTNTFSTKNVNEFILGIQTNTLWNNIAHGLILKHISFRVNTFQINTVQKK